MAKVLKRIRQEVRHAIPAVFYFIIAFNLIHFTEGLSLRPGETRYFSYLTVTIGALIAGKVLMLIDLLPFVNLFPKKPLVYNITWKFCFYNFSFFLFRIAEEFFHLWHHYGDFSVALSHLKIWISTPLFWAIQMWLVVILFVYVVFSEFIRVLGKQKVKHMLFG